MKTKAGVWIDHKKAVIVRVTDKGEEIGMVISKVEKQPRRTGDSPLKGKFNPQHVPADDRSKKIFRDHLKMYYDSVITCLRDAESILIFGPAEAKDELKKALVKNKLGKHVVGVETSDKMTDRQIAAKVHKYFQE